MMIGEFNIVHHVTNRPWTVRFYDDNRVMVNYYIGRRFKSEPTLDEITQIVESILEYNVVLTDLGHNVYSYRKK